ncbi:glycosyltransferase family 39 protein [Rhodovulum sp. PH10]|uniref:glycosyltransferase family 39 protein n=1 Tax=Rhodovulum sp. PH10 TaxID=1187851 RepID=UPI0012F7B5A9|nr:glycosyltransferase family 39 protein [Rhodovulum sp. PH10]
MAAIFTQPLIGFYRPLPFLLLKLQAGVFGWQDPAGYSIVAILVHAGSAAAFYALLARVGLGELARGLAAMLFLASPWASEATCWMSACFDLWAVFLGLLSLLVFCRYLERRSRTALAIATVIFAMALLCKENAVVFGAAFAALAIGKLGWRRFPAVVVAVLPIAGVTLVYLAVRSAILPDLGGAYGTAGALFENAPLVANAGTYVQGILDLGPKLPAAVSFVAFLYLAGMTACLVAAWARPRAAAMCVGLFVVLLAPVLWVPVSLTSTGSGRFLYAPALALLALVGIGAEVIRQWSTASKSAAHEASAAIAGGSSLRRAGRAAFAILVGVTVGVAFLSAGDQVRLWRFATDTVRNTVAYLLAQPTFAGPAVHITNLPLQTVEGPYLLKTYNLHHHLAAAGRAGRFDISADGVMVSARDPAVVVPLGSDPFADPHRPEATVITLPLKALRPGN